MSIAPPRDGTITTKKRAFVKGETAESEILGFQRFHGIPWDSRDSERF
jgi:hypothetical protein